MAKTTYEKVTTLEGGQVFKCPECAYTAKSPQGIGRHRAEVHDYVARKPARRVQRRKNRRVQAKQTPQVSARLGPEPAMRTPFGKNGATLIVFTRSGDAFVGYPAEVTVGKK